MKAKHLLKVVGVSLFAFALAGAGALAARQQKSEPVAADEPDTWMINISADLRSIVEIGGFEANSVWVQTYTDGVGNSKWFQMYPVRPGSMYYQVNAAFPDSYTYNRMQFKFSEGGVEKWGTPNEVYNGSKTANGSQTYVTFAEMWTGDNWDVHFYTYVDVHVKYKDVDYTLEPDIPSKRFIANNVVSDGSNYFTAYYRGGWNELGTILTDHAKETLSHSDQAWAEMSPGTYDVILENNNNGNGVLDILKHESVSETCIYYVLENNVPTNDYIYAWGGEEQFGIWPGTKITEVAGCQEMTNNGILHFEGSETPKLIYRIPVSIGYPSDGDVYFKFNNNNDWESEQRSLKSEHAYWYTGAANYDAAEAIEILTLFESRRNSAEDYSVCNISKANAEFLIGLYNSTTDEIRDYIDRSSVWTYKRDGSDGNELVSYRAVVEEIARIAGIPAAGLNKYVPISNNHNNATTTSIIVIVTISLTMISITALIVIRKRKHQ